MTRPWGAVGVSVRYGRRLALDGVTLAVPAGEVTGVVGGDGAGKTTLLRVLGGALAPTAGEVRRPDDRRIGYLSSVGGSYVDLTVAENLAFTATAYGIDAAELRRRSTDLLDRTGLAASRDKLAGNLSGGMLRKLGVIQALLHRPELVVLDEPSTGIDPVSRADLWWLIAGAVAEGCAVVFTTTYLDEAERAARALALDAGHTLASGTPAEIVAAMPGTITPHPDRPTGPDAERAWRRRGAWRVWNPPSTAAAGAADADPLTPDLQDAVTVFTLAREQAAA